MKTFENKVAVVTGSARGIGYEIALHYAREGASVVVADISLEQSAAAASEIAKQTGAKTLGIALNVTDENSCSQAVDETVKTFGALDILVNNAGITKDGLMLRMKESDFAAVIDVNLKGAFLMSKAAVKFMFKQHSGRIVNIASVVGQAGQAGQANYSASKAGLIGLTKTMAREFASRKILVNAVAPGFVHTKMTESLSEEAKAKILEQIPLKEICEPAEIAKAVLFLTGSSSEYITGQVLAVNGGLYM